MTFDLSYNVFYNVKANNDQTLWGGLFNVRRNPPVLAGLKMSNENNKDGFFANAIQVNISNMLRALAS